MTTRREFLVGAGAGLAALGAATWRGPGRPPNNPNAMNLIDEIVPPGGDPARPAGGQHLAPRPAGQRRRPGRCSAAAAAPWTRSRQGVRVVEADPEVTSVGYGGRPDREGHVTLDACIMDETGNAGAVAFLQDIMHPISVARQVMEDTPHVMLVGRGRPAVRPGTGLSRGGPADRQRPRRTGRNG